MGISISSLVRKAIYFSSGFKVFRRPFLIKLYDVYIFKRLGTMLNHPAEFVSLLFGAQCQ
jgi:hypothetical protein